MFYFRLKMDWAVMLSETKHLVFSLSVVSNYVEDNSQSLIACE